MDFTSSSTKFRVDKGDLILGDKVIPKPKFTYRDKKIAYNQNDVHKLSCSLHAAMTVFSNNFGVELTLEERKSIFDLAVKRGFQKEWGWYMSDGVKCVRDWIELNKGIKMRAYRVEAKQYRILAFLGYGVICGYNNLDGFNQDRFSDGVIGNEDIEYGDKLFGHLVSFWAIGKLFWQKMIYVDNYKGVHRLNETYIDHQGLSNLVDKGVIFKSGYIYI